VHEALTAAHGATDSSQQRSITCACQCRAHLDRQHILLHSMVLLLPLLPATHSTSTVLARPFTLSASTFCSSCWSWHATQPSRSPGSPHDLLRPHSDTARS
jgi:hypothetical protein